MQFIIILKNKMQIESSKNKEWKDALLIIWFISGIVSVIILGITFIIPESFILTNMPICSYKKVGKECIFCGMTRAFLEIKNLNFINAISLNKLSVLVFLLMILNILIIIINLKNKLKIKWEQRVG